MLKVGDRVKMNDRYYVHEDNKGKVFQVIAGPQEICGQPCVWLEGYSGCYAEDGLDKVDSGLKFLDDRYAVIKDERLQKFQEAVKPAIEWFQRNGNPLQKIIIEMGGAELVSGEMGFGVSIPD